MADDHSTGDHSARWRCSWKVEKFRGDIKSLPPDARAALSPYEVVAGEGNMLVTGGVSALWSRLITADGSIASAVDAFDTSSAIGVGDSTAVEAASQTNLQASSNKHYEVVDSAPSHTDSTTASSAQTVTFIATFETGDANFAWNEWGVFNAVTPGRMLNRKVTPLGTKTSADSWVFTVTITIS